jgi:tRNA modification GTPase
MTSANANVIARLTPPGKSAIACVGVAGPAAWEGLRTLFRRPGGTVLTPTPRQVYYGRLGESPSNADDVVLLIREVEPTFVAEIHCHGGPEVIRLLEAQLVERGLEIVSAEAWNARRHGADRAAVQEVLMRCPTTRTAAIALDQLGGAFERALGEVDMLSAGRADEANTRIARLRELVPVGEHLVRPWKVVLAGAPNVGKSSLVNALAGFTRSIVAPTPGTTRDVVSTFLALDGWPVELIDTAGLRDAGDSLEAEGIVRADSARAAADLVLWVLDASAPSPNIPPPGKNSVLVLNKIDCAAGWDVPTAVRASAKTGDGIELVSRAIVERLVPNPPQPGEAVPVIEEFRRRLHAREPATSL